MPPRPRPRWIVAATLACALAAGACGAGASEQGTPTLSKREYIQQADALQRDAAEVFTTLDGRLPATPAEAASRLQALDELIAGHEQLEPPRDWRDEHEMLVASLRTMRESLQVVSKAAASNRRAIEYQVGRYDAAQRDFETAVRSINASR